MQISKPFHEGLWIRDENCFGVTISRQIFIVRLITISKVSISIKEISMKIILRIKDLGIEILAPGVQFCVGRSNEEAPHNNCHKRRLMDILLSLFIVFIP